MGRGDRKQTSKHFKWLRRIINRLRFRHSKFKDGKYTKHSKDIEKWRDDSSLTAADYPDYRWQVVTKGKAKRMVPYLAGHGGDKTPQNNTANQNSENTNHHHHDHDHKCACQTLKELGMVYYDPPLQKSGSTRRSSGSCPQHGTTPNESVSKKSKAQDDHHHIHHDPDHKCACHTLKELGMVWHEPLPKKSASTRKSTANDGTRTVTAELHNELHKKITVDEILSETVKELKLGKESIHQRLQTTPLYKPLEGTDDIPDEYSHLQKANASKRTPQAQSNATAGPRYVPLPSTSHHDQNEIELDLTEVTVPGEQTIKCRIEDVSQGNEKKTIGFDPFSSPDSHHHNIQAESDNDKNHLKSVKGFNDNKAIKNNTKKAGNSPKKPKTPKHRRSFRQIAERKFRKYTVPKGYQKLREEDVDEDIIKMEQDLNIRKERRKQLKKQNVPEWMIAEETLTLKQMNNVLVQQTPHHNHPFRHHHHHHSQSHHHHNAQRHHHRQNQMQSNNGKVKSSQSSVPVPRGSPSAKKGSPRHILYQMQSNKRN